MKNEAGGTAIKEMAPLAESVREFVIRENDTLNYTLKLALDKDGKPLYFYRNIFTPVCYTNECKPVYIDFYWDLLGNYTHYKLPPGKILTKVDHDAFKPEDYEKLQEIVVKPGSIFRELKMEDLITSGTDNLSDSVDAKTGATLKTIKNEVIDGAVYTCFTLWHIAHGKVVPEMQKIIETYKTEALLHSFLTSSNYHYQYWAMKNVISDDGRVNKSFEKDIQGVITGENIFTARAALQQVGNDFFSSPQRQIWLWETFLPASYPMQLSILKKLNGIALSTELKEKLAESAAGSNAEQARLKLDLLRKQPQIPEKTLAILASQLTNSDDEFTSEVYQLLRHFNPQAIDTRKKMETYKSLTVK